MTRSRNLVLTTALAAIGLCSIGTAAALADARTAKGTVTAMAHLRRAAPPSAKVAAPIDRFSSRGDVVSLPTADEIAKTAPAPSSPYVDPNRDSSGAVAIVAMDETNGGPEYEALQSAGVPAVVVPDVKRAIGYRLVILAGSLTSTSLSDEDFKLVSSYVAEGGNLVTEAATAYQLKDVIGWSVATESTQHESLTFCDTCDVAEDIDSKGEKYVALDSTDGDPMGTVGYSLLGDGTDQQVATFDDGSAAAFIHTYGTGHVLAIGARILDLVTRHWEGARYSPRRTYANTAASDADVWLLGLRSLYRNITPGGLTISTSPDGTRAALIPTISANWSEGVTNTPRYVAALRRVGARATVFVPTHYVKDWLDDAFFPVPGTEPNDAQVATTRAILAMESAGAEIASHSVAHSPVFDRLPMGTGAETVANYTPFVASQTDTEDATLSGELRVSRQLLTQFAPKEDSDAAALASVTSFRGGYLLAPRGLAQSLDAAGYSYDSTATQGWVQGAMPFHLPRLDDTGFSNAFEFPITIEDEAKPAFASRIASSASVIAQNAANGVPSVVMVHPNDGKEKVVAYARLMQASQQASLDLTPPVGDAGDQQPLWMGTLRDFGTFWSERDQLTLATYPDSASCKGGTVFVMYNRGATDADGQALDVGDDSMQTAQVNGSTIAVNAYRKVALPTIPAGGAIKGQLCPAYTGPDLAGDYKLIGRTVDDNWSIGWGAHVTASADGTPGDFDISVDLGGYTTTFTGTVQGGGLCLNGPINTNFVGTVTGGCGPISRDGTRVGPIPIFSNGAQIGNAELDR